MIKHRGGCHRSKVRFITKYDPMPVNHCNCNRCRKHFGTVHVFAVFATDDIEIEESTKSMILQGIAVCLCISIFVQTAPLEFMDFQMLLGALSFSQLTYLMILVSSNQKWKFLQIMDQISLQMMALFRNLLERLHLWKD